jgi:hypothetical protein
MSSTSRRVNAKFILEWDQEWQMQAIPDWNRTSAETIAATRESMDIGDHVAVARG